MSYERFWNAADVARFFPVEALTKGREVFLQVHIPIDRIYLDRQRQRRVPHHAEPADGTGEVLVTSEAEILAHINASSPSDPNRILLVVGETGSGKSELCQALNYQLEGGPTHVPILIYRSRTKLRDIVAAIEEKLGESGPEPVELDRVSPAQFSATIKAALLRYVDSEGGETALKPNVDVLRDMLSLPEFEGGLQDVYRKYREEVAQPGGVRLPDLLPLSAFKGLTGAAWRDHKLSLNPYPGRPGSQVEYIHSKLQLVVAEALAAMLKVDDLISKVRRLSDTFAQAGKRPVLLIEDITTFGFLQNDLLDYLFELSRGHFDVVLGITTDFERFNQETQLGPLSTISARLDGRLLLTDDKGRTAFAQRTFVDLARRHLEGILKQPSTLPDWWEVFDGCYPLHPVAIARVWDGLQENGVAKQTPRLLLRVIRDVLEDERIPPVALSANEGPQLRAPRVNVLPTAQVSSELRALATWYGVPTKDGVFVAEEFLDAFAISPAGAQVANGWVIVPLAPALRDLYAKTEPPPGRSVGAPVVVSASPVSTLPPAAQATVMMPAEHPHEDHREEQRLAAYSGLVNWLSAGAEFPHREMLARGVMTALEFFELVPLRITRTDCIADSARHITVQAPSTRESQVAFEGLGQDRDITRVLISRSEHDQTALEWLLRLGSEEGNKSALAEGTSLPLLEVHGYLAERISLSRERARAHLKSLLGELEVSLFAALGKYLLLAGLGLVAEPLPGALTQPIQDAQLIAEPPDASLDPAWKRLCAQAQTVQGLFNACFYLQGSFIDYPLLEHCSERLANPTTLVEILRTIQKADVAQIGNRFAIRGGSLGELVGVVQSFAGAVIGWLRQTPREQVTRRVTRYESLLPTVGELQELRKTIEVLLGYEESKHFMKAAWRRAGELFSDQNVATVLEEHFRALGAVREALEPAHAGRLLYASRHARNLEGSALGAGLTALLDLEAALKDEIALNRTGDSVGPSYQRLRDLMVVLGGMVE